MKITPETIKDPSELRSLSHPELKAFAADVRHFLLENISETGGHIGANLGTVELTLALHLAFESPKDTIIFDTGHQGYTHKIVTGRAHLFPTLNTFGGMSRFLTPQESPHDPIEASHAGTSISMALGIALAKKMRGDQSHTVAVIGDGSLAEGMAWEALNHAATQDVKLTIVVNDNGYAISPGCGGLHQEGTTWKLFETVGIPCIGPTPGHDIAVLEDSLMAARRYRVCAVIAETEKGHGWLPAAKHPLKAHFLMPFDPETGELREKPKESYPDVIGELLEREMVTDDKIVCITPSTLYATGMQRVFDHFQDRCFDPGMEEQHAMTLAAGLAKGGMKPVIAYQSTFAQRAFDQLYHDVCYQNLPVLILLFRSGFAGYDSPTHHGIYDLSYLRGLPNLEIYSPKNREDALWQVGSLLKDCEAPSVVLMPYGPAYPPCEPMHGCGGDLKIYFHGSSRLPTAVVKELRRLGVNADKQHISRMKPLLRPDYIPLKGHHNRCVTISDCIEPGGFGEMMRAAHPYITGWLHFSPPCMFAPAGSEDELRSLYGLTVGAIINRIRHKWPELKLSAAPS